MTNTKLNSRIARRLRGEADWWLSFLIGRISRYPNDQVLRVFAMRRSGHHAILNWIRYHLRGKHYFLNDCKLGENPFNSAVWQSCLVQGYFGEHRLFRAGTEQSRIFTYKGTLIYNFEEVDLRRVSDLMDGKQEKEWIGPSRLRKDIIILRDPFNMLASKLKWAYGVVDRPSKPTLEDVRKSRDLWKIYAQEFLGRTNCLRDRINISYNHWFSDREYRDRLALDLGFKNRDLGIMEVARWGPSLSQDSFDGIKYDGRAQEMRVLDRWQAFKNDSFYLEMVEDKELHKLSNDIFGDLPGTTDLIERIVS